MGPVRRRAQLQEPVEPVPADVRVQERQAQVRPRLQGRAPVRDGRGHAELRHALPARGEPQESFAPSRKEGVRMTLSEESFEKEPQTYHRWK